MEAVRRIKYNRGHGLSNPSRHKAKFTLHLELCPWSSDPTLRSMGEGRAYGNSPSAFLNHKHFQGVLLESSQSLPCERDKAGVWSSSFHVRELRLRDVMWLGPRCSDFWFGRVFPREQMPNFPQLGPWNCPGPSLSFLQHCLDSPRQRQ